MKKSDFLDRITVNPEVMVGKPTIRGLRITVEQILKSLANGVTMGELLEEFGSRVDTAIGYLKSMDETMNKMNNNLGEKIDKVGEKVVEGNKELSVGMSSFKDEISQFRQESKENLQELGKEISQFRQDSDANFQGLDGKYHTVSEELRGIRKALEKRLIIEEEKTIYSAEKKDISE